MKPHLVVRLRAPLDADVPHWETFIADKSTVVESLGPELDRVLRAHRAQVWVTSEYPPAPNTDKFFAARHSGLDRTYRLILHSPANLPDGLVEALRSHPDCESARRAAVTRAQLPRCSRATSKATEWPADMIGLSYIHAFTKGDSRVKIAVLDTGIDETHPELEGSVSARKDVVDFDGLDTASFVGDLIGADDQPDDDVGHGTHVAGIIAGHGRRMPEGVSPRCRLMAVRVLAAMREGDSLVGAGLVDNINVGIKWAVDHGADVINMSLGIRHEHGGLPHAEVIEYALRSGVTVVAAAGNDGTTNKYYPGALPGVMAIGAVDMRGAVAPFSSYGAHISFLAPGTAILSSHLRGGYAASSGTSQAAPFVSGAVGLLESLAREHGRRLGPAETGRLLAHSSDRLDTRRRHPQGGHGVINLADAIRLLAHELR